MAYTVNMSVLFGVFLRSGMNASPDMLAPMTAAAEIRRGGPFQFWAAGPVALGGTAVMASTSGPRLVIVGDMRIGNRRLLTAELGLEPSTCDPAIVLAAYDRWAEGCPTHLIGDFAFMIWDAKENLLFGARDPFGVK